MAIDWKARLAKFRVEFEKAEPAPEYLVLPPDDYLCDVKELKLFTAGTGTPGFKITFVIANGEFAGRKIFFDIWMTEANAANAKRDLHKLGLSIDDLESPPEIGRQFVVSVETYEEGGRERSRAFKFIPNS